MAWRVIDAEDGVWLVMAAAERRADAQNWQLTLRFRCQDADRGPSAFWAQFPLVSGSKSSLFALAERIADDELRQVIADHSA